MLIAYTDGEETLICSKADEKKMIKEWFTKETGRDIDDFDRSEGKMFQVRAGSMVDAYGYSK